MNCNRTIEFLNEFLQKIETAVVSLIKNTKNLQNFKMTVVSLRIYRSKVFSAAFLTTSIRIQWSFEILPKSCSVSFRNDYAILKMRSYCNSKKTKVWQKLTLWYTVSSSGCQNVNFVWFGSNLRIRILQSFGTIST